MKTIIKYFLTLSLLLNLNSCMTDVLDLSPEGGINDGTFWKDETHFKQACNYLYNYLPNWEAILYADNASDYAFGSSPDAISSGTNGILSEDGVWNNSYWYIRAANNIIQKAESSSIADAIKNRYVGEAKFLRALAYFNMVKRFGKVIYIDKCLDVNSPELFAARDEREFVIDKVLEDLDFAQKYLPKASELPEADYGRFTQGAALALKARVALYEGTHQKYHGEGDGKKYLEIAKKTSYSLMTEYKDKYDLYEGTYENLFRFIAEKNCESILSIMYGESIETEDIRLTNCPRYLEAGATRGTRKLINSFLCTDGLPITKSILWKPKEHVKPGDEFINRDPRLRQSFWTISDTYKGGEPYYISYTAYMLKKYCDPEQLGLYEGKDDIMFIRYAEVLLVYAESTYELEGAISDDDLDLSINLLRKRVDMPSLTNKFVQDNGLNMLEEIRRERGVELNSEGFRYDDLIRWKTAHIELADQMLGARYFRARFPDDALVTDNPDEPGTLVTKGDSIVILQQAKTRKFANPKNYLFPLPIKQMQLNSNLLDDQNPGW